MKNNSLATNIMFALGMLYMTLIVYAMTPFTQQLDDIKEAIMYVLAPLPIAAYLLLLGLGYLEVPRPGILWAFLAYLAVMVISTLTAEPYCQWQGWIGVMLQILLLGPFLAFFACSGVQRRLERIAKYISLLAFGCIVFGMLIHGYPLANGDRSGLGTWVRNSYQETLAPLEKQFEKYSRQMEQLQHEYTINNDPKVRAEIASRSQEIQILLRRAYQERNDILLSPIYRLATTFDSSDAKGATMSTILNRQFYAAFLLLVIPYAIGLFLISNRWFGQFLKARTWPDRLRAILSTEAGWQALSLFILLTGTISLYQTESKESIYFGFYLILALIVGLYLFWQRRPWQHRGQVLALLAGLVLVLIPLVLLFFGPKLLRILSPDESGLGKVARFSSSLISRKIIWGGAFGIFFDNPIFGAGPKSFGILFPLYRRPDYFLWEISHRTLSSHNYFVDIFCDTGILGVLTFFSFFLFLVWKILVSIRTDPDPRNSTLSLCAFSGLAGFLLNNMISPNARWIIGSNQLWMAFGIIAGIINRPRVKYGDGEREARHAPTPFQSKIALALFAFALAGWGYSFNYGINFFKGSIANSEGAQYTMENAGDNSLISQLVRKSAEYSELLRKPGITPQQQKETEAQFTAQMEELEKRRMIAIGRYEEAIRLDPHITTAYYKLATLYHCGRRGIQTHLDRELALGAYKALQDLGPDYAQIRLNLSSTYERAGRLDKAIEQGRLAARQTIDLDANKRFIFYLNRAAQIYNAPNLSQYDIADLGALAAQIRAAKDPVSQYIRDNISSDTRRQIEETSPALYEKSQKLNQALHANAQELLLNPALYDPERFANLNIPTETLAELDTRPKYLALARLNRELLCAAWPDISLNEKDNMPRLAARLRTPQTPLDKYVLTQLSSATRKQLDTFTQQDEQKLENLKAALLNGLNTLLAKPGLWESKRFEKIKLTPTTRERIAEIQQTNIPALNRALLADAYPGKIAMNPHDEAVEVAHKLVEWWSDIHNNKKYAEIPPDQLRANHEDSARLWVNTARETGIRQELLKAQINYLNAMGHTPAAIQEITQPYIERNDYHALQELAKLGLDITPSNPSLRMLLAQSYIMQGNLRDAKREIITLDRASPGLDETTYLYYKLYQRAANLPKTLEYAKKYMQTAKNNMFKPEIQKYLAAAQTPPPTQTPPALLTTPPAQTPPAILTPTTTPK